LRVVHAPAKVDLAAAECRGRLPHRARRRAGHREPARHPGPDGARLCRDVPRAPIRPDDVPQRRGYDELVVARSIPVQSGPRSRRTVSADQGHQVVVHLEGDARNRRLVDMRGSTVDYLLEVRLALWLFRRSRSSSTMASRKSRSSPISSPSGRVSASFGGTSTAAGTGGQQEARTTKSLSHA